MRMFIRFTAMSCQMGSVEVKCGSTYVKHTIVADNPKSDGSFNENMLVHYART